MKGLKTRVVNIFVVLCLVIGAAGRLSAASSPTTPTHDAGKIREMNIGGYLSVGHSQVPARFNAGFSFYSAAWPLVEKYQGHQFQSGLYGTWMWAQFDGRGPEKLYSDIEGGLGWWSDTHFPTETPKFIMGGVGPSFSSIANGPSHGWGNGGLYGAAQISPWLLFPLDGLNVRQGACGQLFGYGYLALPLTSAKHRVQTGCVADRLPRPVSGEDPDLVGMKANENDPPHSSSCLPVFWHKPLKPTEQ